MMIDRVRRPRTQICTKYVILQNVAPGGSCSQVQTGAAILVYIGHAGTQTLCLTSLPEKPGMKGTEGTERSAGELSFFLSFLNSSRTPHPHVSKRIGLALSFTNEAPRNAADQRSLALLLLI